MKKNDSITAQINKIISSLDKEKTDDIENDFSNNDQNEYNLSNYLNILKESDYSKDSLIGIIKPLKSKSKKKCIHISQSIIIDFLNNSRDYDASFLFNFYSENSKLFNSEKIQETLINTIENIIMIRKYDIMELLILRNIKRLKSRIKIDNKKSIIDIILFLHDFILPKSTRFRMEIFSFYKLNLAGIDEKNYESFVEITMKKIIPSISFAEDYSINKYNYNILFENLYIEKYNQVFAKCFINSLLQYIKRSKKYAKLYFALKFIKENIDHKEIFDKYFIKSITGYKSSTINKLDKKVSVISKNDKEFLLYWTDLMNVFRTNTGNHKPGILHSIFSVFLIKRK